VPGIILSQYTVTAGPNSFTYFCPDPRIVAHPFCWDWQGSREQLWRSELSADSHTFTLARTKRISVEQRAEAAVIAWMRHKTTGYDGMVIPRVRGKRR
jgi:hypothetical protein